MIKFDLKTVEHEAHLISEEDFKEKIVAIADILYEYFQSQLQNSKPTENNVLESLSNKESA